MVPRNINIMVVFAYISRFNMSARTTTTATTGRTVFAIVYCFGGVGDVLRKISHHTALSRDSTCVQLHPAPNTVQDASLIGQGGSFGRPAFFLEKRHQNTRRSRVTISADLEPPKGLGFGVGFGSGLGQAWGRVGLGPRARLKLTTRVLHNFLCRMQLHIAHASSGGSLIARAMVAFPSRILTVPWWCVCADTW